MGHNLFGFMVQEGRDQGHSKFPRAQPFVSSMHICAQGGASPPTVSGALCIVHCSYVQHWIGIFACYFPRYPGVNKPSSPLELETDGNRAFLVLDSCSIQGPLRRSVPHHSTLLCVARPAP